VDDARLGRKVAGQEKWLDWNLFAEDGVVPGKEKGRSARGEPAL
jgi:hypothetical protein